MDFVDSRTLKLDKILNELDKFVLQFISILRKHTDYVIVSGYVSILFGRARSTEDIDLFIKELSIEDFSKLYDDIKRAGFWCLNAESASSIYDYLKDGLAVRFAEKENSIPNFEVKFTRKKLSLETFNDSLTVLINGEELKISSIERQIAFKRYFLKSDKDIEDSLHLEKVFKDRIDLDKIRSYRKLIENEMA